MIATCAARGAVANSPARARELIDAYLDKLEAAASERHGTVRREERYSYRQPELTLRVREADGGWKSYKCTTRNISANGIGVMINTVLYKNTRCLVELVSLHEQVVRLPGVVMRCEYMPGTTRLHEVGIQFEKPIRIELFHRKALQTRLLIADDEKQIHTLVGAVLHGLNVTITSCFGAQEALEHLLSHKPDLALIDIDLPQTNGAQLAAAARAAGVPTPLVAMVSGEEGARRDECITAGFDLWISKPLVQADLVSLIRSMRCEPVVSNYVRQPNMLGVIDDFAHRASECAGELLRLFSASDSETLRRHVQSLRTEAVGAGFPFVATAAQDVLQAMDEGLAETDRTALRVKLGFLSRLLRSVVGGSCQIESDSK